MNAIIDNLVYINYKYNRELSPHITPDRWALVYGESEVKEMEKAYTQELLGEIFSDDSIPYNVEGGE